jgi:hypothetical protein
VGNRRVQKSNDNPSVVRFNAFQLNSQVVNNEKDNKKK